jgi:Mg-chelatase subunit ChlD
VAGRVRGGRRRGKRRRPGGGDHDLADQLIKEGAAADAAIQQAARRSVSRRELARHERFDEISPEVGALDEAALSDALADDPDDALGLLADLTGATDERLRALARRIASRLVVELARTGPTRRRGVGNVRSVPYRPDGGDIDLDASLDALAVPGAVDPGQLRVRSWVKPGTALCLLVDRSGSMGGAPLATAAVAAAAVAIRAPMDYSVLAFGADVVVAKGQEAVRPAELVVNDVLALRGHGTTDLAAALRAARTQLERSRAARRIAVLLSDCRATVPGDVLGAATALEELWIVTPEEDREDADALAAAVGAPLVTVSGPSSFPAAFATLADR